MIILNLSHQQIAARKQRSTAGAQRSRDILGSSDLSYDDAVLTLAPIPETEGTRVKQKLVELKSRVNEDDLNIKIDKIQISEIIQ